ncbi:MAG: hypothetical protein U9O86_07980 [Campylobacterota bacterium]|nr:hypothetical protein [Campylobacterota bacterium]
MQNYLKETDLINFSHPEIEALDEQLAFELEEHEFDLKENYEEPLPEVIHALKTFTCYSEMIHNFPDIKE